MEQAARLQKSQLETQGGKKRSLGHKKSNKIYLVILLKGKGLEFSRQMNLSKNLIKTPKSVRLNEKIISKFEETIFNQGERIRELINNIEDKNNGQIIKQFSLSKIKWLQKSICINNHNRILIRYNHDHSKHLKTLKCGRKKSKGNNGSDLQKRIELLEKQVFKKRFRKSKEKFASTVKVATTNQNMVTLGKNLNQEKKREHQEP